jgi:NADP-dependent 3-hydroxy acid dehydrogenase YdfG
VSRGISIGPGAVVVVTGASAGVGRAVARAAGARRASVALLARGADWLDGARREIERSGGRALTLRVDVGNADEVDAAAASVEEQLGPIDVWCNVAMATVLARFLDTPAAEYARATETTYLGYVNGTRAALARMVERDRGVIVQVGSALAYRAIPLQAAYCGAKHAIRGFSDAVRCELIAAGSNVVLTHVHLPAVNTPQFDVARSHMPRRARPVAPVYEPEVAARAILYAAEHPRRELWVGHSSVLAIVGSRIAPGLLDEYLGRRAITAQQTAEPEDPDRPANLFEPVPGDHGAHGRFGDEARRVSVQLELSRRRGLVALAGAATLAALGRHR